ncbi:MAG TPA: hypothetical protein VK524_04215 [Polyangiaceae bacterium]|nr:hypothetical protein [Polyangiaceae bacterium]
MPRPRWVWVWVLVPLLGAAELVAYWVFAGRAPRPDAWKEAREQVLPLRRRSELLVVAPSWAEPLARQAFGEELMPLADVARPDASGRTRAIEVSILGQRADEVAGWRETSRKRHGAFEFRVLENPKPVQVRFDFVEGLAPERARVTELLPGGERECAWNARAPISSGSLPSPPTFPARRFQCQGGDYFFVGVTVIDDENYRPRRCIWAHPTGPHALRIRFAQVTLGSTVRGYGMFPWLILRDSMGTPLQLHVAIAGQRIGTFVYRDGQGWTGFEFPTGKYRGQRADVDFEVSSENIHNRHFCFQADTR